MKKKQINTVYIYKKDKKLILTSVITSILILKILDILFKSYFDNFYNLDLIDRIFYGLIYILSLAILTHSLVEFILWRLNKKYP